MQLRMSKTMTCRKNVRLILWDAGCIRPLLRPLGHRDAGLACMSLVDTEESCVLYVRDCRFIKINIGGLMADYHTENMSF
jgi:hypothetical protein